MCNTKKMAKLQCSTASSLQLTGFHNTLRLLYPTSETRLNFQNLFGCLYVWDELYVCSNIKRQEKRVSTVESVCRGEYSCPATF